MSAARGQTLSHFRIVEKIGEGGMGVVYRAEDTKLRRQVALKVLPPDLVANEERRLRFLREARTAAAINHPNIATIHEVDEADGVVFIAMELVEGKTLRDHIRRRPMPIKDALRVATQMAEGLAEAHKARVIHRDLKPENVIVGPSGHVKILDFGLAKLHEDRDEVRRSELSQMETASEEMTRAGRVLGTPTYMSPEQARGQRLDTRSDLFAIGTTFYEMLTGRVPFQGRTNTDILSAIIRDEPLPVTQVRPEIPLELERIVAKCMEKEPADRYQDSRDLVVDLRHLRRTTDPEVQRVQKPGVSMTVSPTGKPRRWMWIAALVALLATASVVTWRHFRSLPRFQSGDRIIVADFENKTGRPVFNTALRDSFEEMLWRSTFLRVIRGKALEELLQLQSQNIARLDSRLLNDICSAGRCEGYLIGKIESVHEGLQLEVSLWMTDRREPILTRSAIAASEEGVLLAIHGLALDLREALGEAPDSLSVEAPPTTNSLLAYQAYSRATALYTHSAKQAIERIALCTEAIEFDPGFLEAWEHRGFGHYNAGRIRDARRDAKKAHELSHGRSDRRRLRAKMLYLTDSYDFDGAIAAALAYRGLFPHDPLVHNILGQLYWYGYADYPVAEKHFRSQLRVSRIWGIEDICALLGAQGRSDDIHHAVIDYKKINGLDANVGACPVLEDLARGDLRKALDTIDHLADTAGTLPTDLALLRLEVLLAHGRLAEAESVAPAVWRRALIDQSGWTIVMSGILQAWLGLRRETTIPTIPEEVLGTARQNLPELNRFSTFSADVGHAGPLPELIREHALIEEGSKSWYVRDTLGVARGALALINGKADEAIALLAPLARDSNFTYRHHVLGRAYESATLLQEAVAEYEWVVKQSRSAWESYDYIVPAERVLDQFRLARVYEKLGDTDRARQWYERFTEDWKGADPDIPELIEARKRLAQLKQGTLTVP